MSETKKLIEIADSAFRGRVLAGWVGAKDYYSTNSPWTPPDQREWFIYFLQGDDGGPIKIGRTKQVRARITDVQVGYPFGRLRLVGLIVGPRTVETDLHERFGALRLQGEWFRAEPDLIDFIATHAAEVR